MLTGRKGWHRRINKNFNQVARTTDLLDNEGDALADDAALKIQAAAKAAVCKQGSVAEARPIGQLCGGGASSSSYTPGAGLAVAATAGEAQTGRLGKSLRISQNLISFHFIFFRYHFDSFHDP